jgi:hypothetical protein
MKLILRIMIAFQLAMIMAAVALAQCKLPVRLQQMASSVDHLASLKGSRGRSPGRCRCVWNTSPVSG